MTTFTKAEQKKLETLSLIIRNTLRDKISGADADGNYIPVTYKLYAKLLQSGNLTLTHQDNTQQIYKVKS